jgi:hypothetical protein
VRSMSVAASLAGTARSGSAGLLGGHLAKTEGRELAVRIGCIHMYQCKFN